MASPVRIGRTARAATITVILAAFAVLPGCLQDSGEPGLFTGPSELVGTPVVPTPPPPRRLPRRPARGPVHSLPSGPGRRPERLLQRVGLDQPLGHHVVCVGLRGRHDRLGCVGYPPVQRGGYLRRAPQRYGHRRANRNGHQKRHCECDRTVGGSERQLLTLAYGSGCWRPRGLRCVEFVGCSGTDNCVLCLDVRRQYHWNRCHADAHVFAFRRVSGRAHRDR